MYSIPIKHYKNWSIAVCHHSSGRPDTWVIKYEGGFTDDIAMWKFSSKDENLIAIRTTNSKKNHYEDFYISLADAKTPMVRLAFQTLWQSWSGRDSQHRSPQL